MLLRRLVALDPLNFRIALITGRSRVLAYDLVSPLGGLGKQALVDVVDRVVAELLQLLDFNDVQKLQSLVCHLASYQRTPSRLATNGRS